MKKISFFVAVLSLFVVSPALADHAWGTYHWARSSNPFNLALGDNVSSTWDSYLATTASDWSLSSVLDLTIVAGSGSKNCKAVPGRVEVCAAKYGRNGWLGIASIWASGEHITQGTVKLNDTYFNTAKYNTPAWRNLVMCQEVGHTFGLDHQDEDFLNAPLGTCMDYTNDPTPNQHPNLHDYEMLETMYAHLDGSTTTTSSTAPSLPDIDSSDPGSWGREIHTSADGHASLYERDFGNGRKLFTHVYWVDPSRKPSH